MSNSTGAADTAGGAGGGGGGGGSGGAGGGGGGGGSGGGGGGGGGGGSGGSGGGGAVVAVEDQVSAFLKEMVHVDALEEGFNFVLVHHPELDKANHERSVKEWIELLRRLSTETSSTEGGGSAATSTAHQQDLALRIVVAQMARQTNPKVLKKLRSLLEDAVGALVVSARQVCDAVLTSEALRPEHAAFWTSSFALVRRIIGGVDYKGVREIMKNSIEKVAALPAAPSLAQCQQLAAIKHLLEYIFDRNAALLPGYFIVNEILKSYPENKSWPHPSFVPLVASFLDSFRPTAQMVTSLHKHRMRPVVEQTGKAHSVSTWRLDPNSLKFLLKVNQTYERTLPYERQVIEPQTKLMLHILRQPYSKEMVNSMCGIQKPRKDGSGSGASAVRYPAFEGLLAQLFVIAMKESSCALSRNEDDGEKRQQLLWRTLTSNLILFVLFQNVNFGKFMERLASDLVVAGADAIGGRGDLFWCLMQYISGSITKNPVADFSSVLRLFSLLYGEEPKPLPVPDLSRPESVRELAAATLFTLLRNKAEQQGEAKGLMSGKFLMGYPIPLALREHEKFLRELAHTSEAEFEASLSKGDYLVPVLCNTLSTGHEIFQKHVITIYKVLGAVPECTETINLPGPRCFAAAPTEPLPMALLDSMSVHTKISLVHGIVQHILKHVGGQSGLPDSTNLSPALVESYCRLLVSPEIENLGVKSFLNQLLPATFKQGAWGALHLLLEVASHRLHHVQANFRLSLLNHLQVALAGGAHPILNRNAQLNICIESTCLRLITGLGTSEVSTMKNHPALSASSSSAGQQQGKSGNVPPMNVMYGDNEELNRLVVLTLARAVHVNGLEQISAQWVKEVLSAIMQKTPHSWPSHTTMNFPPILQEFFKEHQVPVDDKAQLMQKVEEEYKVWNSMKSELEIIERFSAPSNTLFLCVLWKILLDTEQIPAVAYQVFDRIGSKQMMLYLRSFCDVMVCEFSKSGGSGHVNKCIEAMNDLIWKYNVFSIDRLILCMSLRTNEGNEAQVCFFIIQLLLLKPPEFRSRVSELVRTMSPEHQLLQDFHRTHMDFHQKFPERFCYNVESVEQDSSKEQQREANHHQTMPTYFSNVCLRFIPVFDIVVHRFLELPQLTKALETLIDHVAVLYKFHDKPMTYLYNTLHYFEQRLRDRPSLRKKLISSITGALKEVRPPGWCLTSEYQNFLSAADETEWTPPPEYFLRLLGRLARSVSGHSTFPYMDWRFNEFPNEGAHALYATCVEVMGLPIDPVKVGGQILNVVLEHSYAISPKELPDWYNAAGLLLANLPDAYFEGLTQRLVAVLSSSPLSHHNMPQLNIFRLLSTDSNHSLAHLLALAHAAFHHTGLAQIQTLPELVRKRMLPIIKNEEQLLFVLHLTGPFLQRLHSESRERLSRPLSTLTVELYRALLRVDREGKGLRHMDAICDILYHVKYQFTGDSVRQDAERIIRELSPPLQLRLRFIAPGILQQNH